MNKDDLILGRVNLNFGKDKCSPVIEILDDEGASDGDIVVLRVERISRYGTWENVEKDKK